MYSCSVFLELQCGKLRLSNGMFARRKFCKVFHELSIGFPLEVHFQVMFGELFLTKWKYGNFGLKTKEDIASAKTLLYIELVSVLWGIRSFPLSFFILLQP